MSDLSLIDLATQKIIEQGFNPATARAIAGIAASVFTGDAAIRKDAGLTPGPLPAQPESSQTSLTNPDTLIALFEGRLAGVKEQSGLARTHAWQGVMEGKVEAWEEALKLLKEHAPSEIPVVDEELKALWIEAALASMLNVIGYRRVDEEYYFSKGDVWRMRKAIEVAVKDFPIPSEPKRESQGEPVICDSVIERLAIGLCQHRIDNMPPHISKDFGWPHGTSPETKRQYLQQATLAAEILKYAEPKRELSLRQLIETVQAFNTEGLSVWRVERFNAALAWLQSIESNSIEGGQS